MPSSQSYRVRRGTAAQWAAANPVLAAGEPGYATDTGTFKIGDGATAWATLPGKGQQYSSAADYGAVGDGTTDDTSALNSIPANAGEVVLAGTFKVTAPIVVQAGVTLRGIGPRDSSKILADTGFSGSHLIDLGGGATAHGTRVEHLSIDCAGLVATGVKGDDIQELSGIRDCVVSGFTAVGADFSGTGTSQNYVVEGVEFYAQTAATNIVGIRTKAGAFIQSLSNITIILGTLGQAAASGSVGIELNGPVGLASGLHFESTVVGVKINGATGSSVLGVSGIGGTQIVTDLVQVANSAQDNITIMGLFGNGSTKTLNDLLHSYSYAGNLSLYTWSGGGVGSDNVLNMGDPAAKPMFRAGVDISDGGTLYGAATGVLRTSGRFDAVNDMYARIGAAQQVFIGAHGLNNTPIISFGSAQDTVLERTGAKILKQQADNTFTTGRDVTASRPNAATVGAGAQFYDTTLSKPIWSNGTVWKDAAGTTV